MDRPSNWIEYPNRREYDRVIRLIHQGIDTDHARFSDSGSEWWLMTTESPNGGPHNVFLENKTTGAIVAMGLVRRNLKVIKALLDERFALAELEGRDLCMDDMHEFQTALPRWEEDEAALLATWNRRRQTAFAILNNKELDPDEARRQAACIVAGVPVSLTPADESPSFSPGLAAGLDLESPW